MWWEQFINFALCICTIAWLMIFCRMRYHFCSYWIEFYRCSDKSFHKEGRTHRFAPTSKKYFIVGAGVMKMSQTELPRSLFHSFFWLENQSFTKCREQKQDQLLRTSATFSSPQGRPVPALTFEGLVTGYSHLLGLAINERGWSSRHKHVLPLLLHGNMWQDIQGRTDSLHPYRNKHFGCYYVE